MAFILHPKSVVYALLFLGLAALATAIIANSIMMAAAVIAMPLFLFLLISGMQYPMVSYISYCAITFYYAAIYRYANIEGLSGILDTFLAICLFSIGINLAGGNNSRYHWKNLFNILVIGELCWIVFRLLELFAPYTQVDSIMAHRSFFIALPISYLLSGVLLDSHKKLKISLILIGVYVITAALKLLWQKIYGWDQAEIRFLMQGAWHTHLLRDGIRYFSFFSDAGNFGASMGVFFTTFAIISTALKKGLFKYFCITITALAGLGMIMSGTRGAMVIPFAGIVLYTLLAKNTRIFFSVSAFGILAFCFFYFTNIGNSNGFIRRARTAFRPNEDASFNVRLENQKRIAYYLKDKPFGVGIGGHLIDTERILVLDEEYIPTDSHFVDMWVETGIVGLCLYITILVSILLRCCYILFFKIRHSQLRKILIGLLAGIFGLWLNGYVGRATGFTPGTLLIPIFLSFVLNGPYIEKHMPKDYRF